MAQRCDPCGGIGFVNTEQLDELIPGWREMSPKALQATLRTIHEPHDVFPCACCGSGDVDVIFPWHGVPGEHYNDDDPRGPHGPYVYNGGLCECH